MANPHIRTDGLARRRSRLSGDVSTAQLVREVDVAYRAWCERRGIGRWAPDPIFNRGKVSDEPPAEKPVSKSHRGGRRMGDVLCPKLHEIANAIVAMGTKAPRGTMTTLAARHQLSYGSLASMVSAKRRAQRQKEQAA